MKDCLKQAPVLLFIDAAIFQFKTDASAVGLVAVLKQNGHPSSSHAPPEYKRLQRIVVGFARKQLQHDLQAFQTPDRPQPYKLAGNFNIVLQYNALSCCMPPDDK